MLTKHEVRDPTNPDPGVRVVVSSLGILKYLVPYQLLAFKKSFDTIALAYTYVIAWVAVLAALVATSDSWVNGHEILKPLIVAIAAYRVFDILRYWADLLLNLAHRTIVSAERNLLFAVANLVELTLVAAIWFRATGQSPSAGSAMFAAFSLVTQLAEPLALTAWSKVAVAATEIASLILLLGAVALLISEVQKKLEATGKWGDGPRRHSGG